MHADYSSQTSARCHITIDEFLEHFSELNSNEETAEFEFNVNKIQIPSRL